MATHFSLGPKLKPYTELSVYDDRDLAENPDDTETIGNTLIEVCQRVGVNVETESSTFSAGLKGWNASSSVPHKDSTISAIQDMLTKLKKHSTLYG